MHEMIGGGFGKHGGQVGGGKSGHVKQDSALFLTHRIPSQPNNPHHLMLPMARARTHTHK